MKTKIKVSFTLLVLFMVTISVFAAGPLVQESKIVKFLESNKSYAPIKARISLQGFYVDDNGCITTEKLKSKKFSIISMVNLLNLTDRLPNSYDGMYTVEFVLHSENPKVYFLKSIEGLENLTDYYNRLIEEVLMEQRVKNAKAGLGAITDQEVIDEIAKNKSAGLGELTNAQIQKQIKEREKAEIEKNKLAGLGAITDAQVVSEKASNVDKGLGEFTNKQIEVQRTKNKDLGLGAIADSEVAAQREKNRKNGLGSFTDQQIAEKQKKLAKAKNYEKNKQWFNALISYYDYIEDNPTLESIDVYHSFSAIADAIRAGNPGLGSFDIFSKHDGWKNITEEYKKYCSSVEGAYGAKVSGLRKVNTDYSKRTVTYRMSAECKYTKDSRKFKMLDKILKEGYNNAKARDWNDVPEPSCAIAKRNNYAIKFVINDEKGKNITGMIYTRNVSSDITVSVDATAMDIIDSGKYSIQIYEFGYTDSSNVFHDISSEKMDLDSAQLVRALEYCGTGFVNIPNKKYVVQKTEMPQWLYEFVMGSNPSRTIGDDLPVESVSWFDAVVFCNKFSDLMGLEPAYTIYGTTDTSKWNYEPHDNKSIGMFGDVYEVPGANGFRLPKSDEWFFAAKGGEKYRYSGSNTVYDVAWCEATSPNKEIHKCGTKKPNGYGLYDMSGNVREWCYDLCRKEITIDYKYVGELKRNSYGQYYEDNVREVPVKGFGKYCLGGSSWTKAEDCLVTHDAGEVPNLKYDKANICCFSRDIGFRVVRDIK